MNKKKQLVFITVFFACLYMLISLVNHYVFRTYALDLGAYTNALYDYIHLNFNDSTVFKEIPETYWPIILTYTLFFSRLFL